MDIGIVCFETVDSYDLNYANKNKIIINGNIFYPNIQQDSYNAVIMTHGSGGQRRYHNKYIELLTDMGLVVFQLDHYSARKIKYDKKFSKVSGLTFMNDAYAALKLIKTNPVINNVGYLGWSQGGVGPILSHFKFVNDILPFDERFHASIALYPYCGFTFPNNAETETPLLMITGSDDDLTPEAACRNIYSKFFRNDKKIKFISMENARHGFDNPFLYFGFTFDKLPNLKIINKECTLTINKNGEINNMEGVLINTPEMSEYFLNKCSFKGVTVKYNSQATKKTLNEVKQFFNENLINK
jgi:dienelactone hydrolase